MLAVSCCNFAGAAQCQILSLPPVPLPVFTDITISLYQTHCHGLTFPNITVNENTFSESTVYFVKHVWISFVKHGWISFVKHVWIYFIKHVWILFQETMLFLMSECYSWLKGSHRPWSCGIMIITEIDHFYIALFSGLNKLWKKKQEKNKKTRQKQNKNSTQPA